MNGWNPGAARLDGWTGPESLRDAALTRLAQLSRAESIISTALVHEIHKEDLDSSTSSTDSSWRPRSRRMADCGW